MMNQFQKSVPDAKPSDIIEWARSLKVNGHGFDPELTPQIVEPIKAMADSETRIGTLIKPVQVGGSTAGEVVLAYWAAFASGLIQFNWQDDETAAKRWHDRIFPTLESCPDIKRSGHRFEEVVCTARYPNATVRVQGVFMESALDSDTVPYQINEEVHLWKPGFLSKARRRQTRVWNAKAFDISNAGNVGDQLYSSYEDGTCEKWEVKCPNPKCGLYHEMRFRFNPNKPELGGLRWESDGCKLENGRFDYNRLEKTIRYEFPCGHIVRDLASERRTLSGKYSTPTNQGAHLSHRSWNFEAVSCDAIKWLSLIQEWHASIRALRVGDSEPMRRFVTERECRFYDQDSIPFNGQIVVSPSATKTREGLPDRAVRVAFFDWQQGYKSRGQLIHYWGVIEDVKADLNSQIVFEGKLNSESELIDLLKEYQVEPIHVLVDASKNTKGILQFCYQNGFKAVMGNASHVGLFRDHEDGIPRFYSSGTPIFKQLNVTPVYEQGFSEPDKKGNVTTIPDPQEPVVILYNLGGLLANHFFRRELKARVTANCAAETPPRTPEPYEYFERVIPSDVSEDFMRQYQSWERLQKDAKQKPGDIKSPGLEMFRQIHPDDHLLQCCAGIDMFLEWSFMLGDALANLGIKPQPQNEPNDTAKS